MTTPTTPSLDDGYQVPEEERGAPARGGVRRPIRSWSRASATSRS